MTVPKFMGELKILDPNGTEGSTPEGLLRGWRPSSASSDAFSRAWLTGTLEVTVVLRVPACPTLRSLFC